MKWLLTFAVASVFFGMLPCALAQQAPVVQVDPQAVAIVNQSLSSMGVANYVQGIPQTGAGIAVEDSLATGTVSMWDGTSGTIAMKTKGLGLTRTDININGNQTTTVTNNGSGFVVQAGTKSSLPVWVTQYRRSGNVPVFSRMADYAQQNTNLTYVGLETLNGASVHHVQISSAPTDGTPPSLEKLISEFHVFVDANSLLVVKTLSFDLSPFAMENRVAIETYFSNYQSVSGVLVPFHITRYLRDRMQVDIVLTSVQFNVGLPVTDFQ